MERLKLIDCTQCQITFCIPVKDKLCPECKTQHFKVRRDDIRYPDGFVNWDAFEKRDGICYISRHHQPFTYQQMILLAMGNRVKVERMLVLGDASGVSLFTLLFEIQNDDYDQAM